MNGITEAIQRSAREALDRWASFAQQYWFDLPGGNGLGGWGSGYNAWGVQTNQKYLAAMAVLSQESADANSFPREQALTQALAALRFCLASHKTGSQTCTDNTQWGRTWISPLGIERMMHALETIDSHLTAAERDGIRVLLADEACFQLTETVYAAPWNGAHENRPESNIWNGAVCARAALMNPDSPRAEEWIERAHTYFFNGISVAEDALDDTVVAGKAIRERHVGANFFPHYALDHHGYLNVGYMVICLSNIAMLHYSFRHLRAEPPASLYHHARDLWAAVRRWVGPDGRLLRIGGDTRQRYCYCQDYLIPVLYFAADAWGDPHAATLLEGALDLIVAEQAGNADGSFLGTRLSHLKAASPYYHTRLESDKAVVLSMLLAWMKRAPLAAGEDRQSFEQSVAGGWHEPEHGAVMHRSPTRYTSWSWRAAEGPQGLCLPPDATDMFEWNHNLSGRIRVQDDSGARRALGNVSHSFDGGFLTWGRIAEGCDVFMHEGWRCETSATHALVFAALPDGHTNLLLEYATLEPRRVYLREVAGCKLEIPNDLFNRNTRVVETAQGTMRLEAYEGPRRRIDLESPWVCIENRVGLVGVYGGETWSLLRHGHRIGGKMNGSILAEAFCFPLRDKPWDAWGPAPVLDTGCAILSSVDAGATAIFHEKQVRQLPVSGTGNKACRAVQATGRDGKTYLLAANFGDADASVSFGMECTKWADLAEGNSITLSASEPLALAGQSARLLCAQG